MTADTMNTRPAAEGARDRQAGVKAVVMAGPGNVETRSFVRPKLPDGAILLDMEMCGICGTDKHTYKGETVQFAGTPAESHTPFPIIPGHEIVGRIAEIGGGVVRRDYDGDPIAVGDRVVMCPDILCGECFYCRNTFGFPLCENIKGYGNAYSCAAAPHLMGGWAETIYVRPDAFVYKVPEELPPEIAVMTELMAVTCNIDKARDMASMADGLGSGSTVVVQGVGPMGILHVLKAHILGAGRIIALDKSDFRLDLARQFGADHTISVVRTSQAERVARVKALSHGRGADLVIECTGEAEAIPEGFELIRRGGTYVVAGVFADVGEISINPHRHLLANQVRLIGLTNHPPSGYTSSMRLLGRFMGRFPLEKFVTHRFPLTRPEDAMRAAFDIDRSMKVVFTGR